MFWEQRYNIHLQHISSQRKKSSSVSLRSWTITALAVVSLNRRSSNLLQGSLEERSQSEKFIPIHSSFSTKKKKMMHAEAQLSKVAPYHLPPPRVLEFQRVPAIRPGLLTPLPLPAELPQLPSKPGPQASTQKWGAFSCGSCCFFSSRKKWRHHQVETKWLTREVPL